VEKKIIYNYSFATWLPTLNTNLFLTRIDAANAINRYSAPMLPGVKFF